MYILIEIILLSVIFERQARRHRFEKSWEYKQLGIPMPAEKPRMKALEALVSVVIGLFLLALGGVLIVVMIELSMTGESEISLELKHKLLVTQMEPAAVFLAAGVALAWLGLRAAWMRRKTVKSEEKSRPGRTG